MILPLPIDPILPALADALANGQSAVLQAPPGAGKTTRVPLALLDAPWLQGRRIIMLEPRRLAARAAAARMAATLGEKPGETIGYRVRLDSRIGPRTRIEVVTEGVLIRQLQADPGLEGVGAVLFDEFHERSLDGDLGLALALDAQGALRDDLRLLVMSATLDGEPVARLLGGAPILTSEGRAFPVETRYMPGEGRIEPLMAAACRTALAEETGDILAFLPGTAEIRRTASLLSGLPADIHVAPLYGDLEQAAQDRAIAPSPAGKRKIVLATSIAETSLTIEGVRVVIDSGLSRQPRFDPRTGMSRLATVRASLASAEQRRGRAGRLAPGVCYRLWDKAAEGALPRFSPPEMLVADLAPLALDLAAWGVADPAQLAWLDPPPAAPMAQARELLTGLGALDESGTITRHGRALAALPMHPRLAHMVTLGAERGEGSLACLLAALLGERDPMKGAGADITARIEAPGEQVRRTAALYAKRLGVGARGDRHGRPGGLLALAYPDRIGQRRGAQGQYRLANGRGAVLAAGDPLAASDLLAVAELDGGEREARIYLAAPLDQAELEDLFRDRIEIVEEVEWDRTARRVSARRVRRLGALVLSSEPVARPSPARVAEALLSAIRADPDLLPWSDAARELQARVGFLRRVRAESWPDLSDGALVETLEQWLAPRLEGIRDPAALDLASILRDRLAWNEQRTLDAEAPTHLTVPTGMSRRLDYRSGDVPVLAVRLQEMFGQLESPSVAGIPVLLHLLSPAGRPLQVTRDLKSFWAGSYKAVRADMRGQYPKHPWPEDPTSATPTSRAKPRS